MKVLFLFSNSNIGGAERSISRMIFSHKNNDFVLATIKGEGPWCEWVRENNYSPKVLGNKKSFLNTFYSLIQLLKKEKFDIVYVFGLKLSILVRLLKLFYNFKIIHGVRWNPQEKNYLNLMFSTTEFFLSSLIDGYITNSYTAKQTLTDKCNIDNFKVENIYNGINFVNSKYQKIKKKNIVLILANLTPRKGHLEFLEVIKRVIKVQKDTTFIFLGRDEMNGLVQKKIKQKRLSKNVFYVGFKNNVTEWILKSKFLVLPSLWGEGCPTSILEAFSLNTPAIAYDIDGNHEIIEDNVNGFLINKNDKENFSKKIIELLTNQEKLNNLKKNTTKNLKIKFNLKNCYIQHQNFFKLIKKKLLIKKDIVNVLIIVNSLDLGGTENHLLNVLKNINKSKIRISLFVLKANGILEQTFRKNEIEIIQSKSNIFFSILKLRKVIKKHNPIIHCFLPKSYLIGGIISLIYSRNILLMSRRSRNNYQKNRYFFTFLEKFLHTKINLGIANSKKVYHDLIDEGIEEDKLKLIYNGVNTDDYKPNKLMRNITRKKLGIKNNEITILYIANYFRYKGHDDFIEALNLKKDLLYNKFKVIFIGKDYGRLKKLRKKINLYGLDKNFIFLNETTDVKSIFPASDVGVLASYEEGFSNFVLESMSSGLAMIASKVGGNVEAIEDGKSGFLFSAKNINELSECIVKLINNENLILKLGYKARKRVNKLFNIDYTVKKYEELYLNLNKL